VIDEAWSKDELRKMSEADAVLEHNAHDKNLVRWDWAPGTDLSKSLAI